MCSCFSRVWIFATLWTIAHQASVHGIFQARVLEWGAIAFSTFQVVLVVKNPPANAGYLGDGGLVLGSERSPQVGNGNLLQDFCLENSMDRRTWWATVHEVARSWTRLTDRAYWICYDIASDVYVLFFFFFFFFGHEACGFLAALTRNPTHAPCIGRQCLNHWTAREVPPKFLILIVLLNVYINIVENMENKCCK